VVLITWNFEEIYAIQVAQACFRHGKRAWVSDSYLCRQRIISVYSLCKLCHYFKTEIYNYAMISQTTLSLINILGPFSKLLKETISFIMIVCPHVTTWLRWTDFQEIWYLKIFQKSIQKIQVLLISDKNIGYFTWRTIYIYDNTSPKSSQNEKCFRQICRENQNTFYMLFIRYCRKICTARQAIYDSTTQKRRDLQAG